jgi:imidazolonepropionase-like amidohydrolase
MKMIFHGGIRVLGGDSNPIDLVVSEDRVEVVTDAERSAEDVGEVYDARGMTLMPGLHMCHWHPDFGYLDYDGSELIGAKYPPGVQTLIAAQWCDVLLTSGITGIAGAGCGHDIDAALLKASQLGVKILPRILPSGPMVGTTGQPELDVANWWEQRGNTGTYVTGNGPEEMRGVVRTLINRGARIIKIIYSAGRPVVLDRNDRERMITLDELAAIVDTAHDRGCMVRAHVVYRERIRECLEAGVDLIDHGDEVDEELAMMMAEQGTFWVPSPTFVQYMIDSHRRHGKPTAEDAIRERLLEQMREMVTLADSRGARILLGDDFGLAFLEHRPGIYGTEMSLWSTRYGFAPQDVLRWATANGAALMGLGEGRGGVLETGAVADFLVLRSNPVDDISLFEQPEKHLAAIVAGGKVYKNELPTLTR